MCDGDDDESAVEEHHVDGEPHAEGVDAPQRIGEQETLPRFEAASSEQPACRPHTEGVGDREARNDHDTAICVEQSVHGASVPVPGRTRTRAGRAVCCRTRTHPNRSEALRYAPRMLCEDFHSGDDVVMEFLGRTYSFARRDFEQRVVRAAVDLELAAKPLSRSERDDLVTAAIAGSVETPRSDVGDRIGDLQAAGGEDPVYWLRKLVFRSAWLDHRIKSGHVDVAFDDETGAFRIEPGRYPLPGEGHPVFATAEAKP